jgi:hypothetical protein
VYVMTVYYKCTKKIGLLRLADNLDIPVYITVKVGSCYSTCKLVGNLTRQRCLEISSIRCATSSEECEVCFLIL